MQTDAIDFANKTKLVDALLACPSIQDRQTRNVIVSELKNVQGIPRSDIDRTDVGYIVSRTSDFKGGLSELHKVLRFYEGDSVHMQQVDAIYGQPRVPDNNTSDPDKSTTKSFYTWLVWSIVGLMLIVILIAILRGIDSTYVNPVDDATYVYVPAGEFIRGSSKEQMDYALKLCKTYYDVCQRSWYEDEQPQHTVYMDSYWIMQTEVTNDQYHKFMDAGGYTTKAYWGTEGRTWRTKNRRIQPRCWNDIDLNGRQQPVVCVSWYEAEAYANWLSAETGLDFGLPTEAQWEKAARGIEGRVYPWGNQRDGNYANFCDINCTFNGAYKEANDGYQYPAPIGSYPAGASPYDVLDMAGNVWEWTADWYVEDYYQSSLSRNPQGPPSGEERVFRGGSWNHNPFNLRTANRYRDVPTIQSHHIGFRLVRHETPREN